MNSESTIMDNGMSITVTVTNSGQHEINAQPLHDSQDSEASQTLRTIHEDAIKTPTWLTRQVSARVTPEEHALILAKGGLKSILRDVLRTRNHTEEVIDIKKEKIEATESRTEGVVKLAKWHARQVDHLVNKASLFKSQDDLVMFAVSEFLIRHNLTPGTQHISTEC